MFTAKQISALPKGIHRYERGLYVRVTDSSRYWIFKYQLNGSRHELGLGSATDQTISAVLAKVAPMRALITQGVDPAQKVEEKKIETRKKVEAAKCDKAMPTFSEFYPGALEKIFYLRRFANRYTEHGWRQTMKELDKTLGKKRIDQITRDDVVGVLKDCWTTGERKARDRISRLQGLFNIAMSEGLIDKNPAAWKGNLDAILPSQAIVFRDLPQHHHAAVSAEELATIAQELWKQDTVPAMAVLFGMLTVGRSSEYRKAEWSEINFEDKVFSVPPVRRKDKKPYPHRVPLSRQALAVLERVGISEKYVFESCVRADVPVAAVTALKQIRAMTDKPITLHGSRSTFADWCAKNEKNYLLSEKCLMHAVGNEVFRAYQRDDLLEQRRKLMQEWADFLLPEL